MELIIIGLVVVTAAAIVVAVFGHRDVKRQHLDRLAQQLRPKD